MRRPLFISVLALLLLSGGSLAGAQTETPSIVGAWVLNLELSDKPPALPEGGDGREGRRGPGAGGRSGGRGGGFGGRGGGGLGRGGGRGDSGPDREEMERRMNAVRDVARPAERLTIVRTDSMVIITAGDGRTTRLSPDNSKIKEIGSGIERKTRWEGGRLVTEISGLGRGKATESYSVDPATRQLIVLFEMEAPGGRDRDGNTPGGLGGVPQVPRRRVYDPQQP